MNIKNICPVCKQSRVLIISQGRKLNRIHKMKGKIDLEMNRLLSKRGNLTNQQIKLERWFLDNGIPFPKTSS